MDRLFRRIKAIYVRGVWSVDLRSAGRARAGFIRAVRVGGSVLRHVTNGDLTLRAMSLVYTTLLSLVPLLAVSFSVLKAFGVHNQIEPFLLAFLAPLGEKGAEVTSRVIGFVENMRVGVLGSLGLVLLIYTVITVVQKVESAFNSIWCIDRARRLLRKFSDYLSVILIGPVLVFAALGISAAAMNTAVMQKLLALAPLSVLVEIIGWVLPYVLVCGAFTFLYMFIPNTRVRFLSALAGGVTAGVLWESSGLLFAAFVVYSGTYTAIYAGFAILITFMIWLYVSWLILLIGAQVSYYHQHAPTLVIRRGTQRLSNRMRERYVMMIMVLISYNFHHRLPRWTRDALADRLGIPMQALQFLLDTLEQEGFILPVDDDPVAYVPARDMETVTLAEVIDAARGAGERMRGKEAEADGAESPVQEVMSAMDDAIADALRGRTLKDIMLAHNESR